MIDGGEKTIPNTFTKFLSYPTRISRRAFQRGRLQYVFRRPLLRIDYAAPIIAGRLVRCKVNRPIFRFQREYVQSPDGLVSGKDIGFASLLNTRVFPR